MLVLRQHITILLAMTVISCMSSMLRLLLTVDSRFENDVARYINQQKQSSSSLSHNVVAPQLRNAVKGKAYDSVKQQQINKTKATLVSQSSGSTPKHIMKQSNESATTTSRTRHTSHSISVSSDKHLHDDTREHKQHEIIDDVSFDPQNMMYWNLSCPLELSMFSGAHMGGDYLARAEKARAIAEDMMNRFNDVDWKSLENRRIFFVGDSLLRQVFISMACLSWDKVTSYAIPWFEKRGVRTRQPHTIGSGSHSKFEEGRVLLQGNIELIYHHGIGGLLELGDEYESHDPNLWIKSCFMKKPFTAMTPKLPQTNQEIKRLSTVNVEREQLTVKSTDIVLINASVHASRSFNLRNIVDLFHCKPMMQYPERLWPKMLYIATGPSHFPTETGAFEQELLDMDGDYDCRMMSSFHGYQDDEVKHLDGLLPIIGRDILPFQYESGNLHVGGKDCLHWLQPGIPDLVSKHVMDAILSAII